MRVEIVPIDRVVPYARNPRKNEPAVDKVAASLVEYGWRQPIVVDPSMVIVAGHTRYLAARRLGYTEVPVHIAEGLSATQLRAYRLADNRTHQDSEWDTELLGLELRDLQAANFDLRKTAFTDEELRELLAAVGDSDADPDDAPDVPEDARSGLGDVWLLGAHRVSVGDATDPDVLRRALNGALADIVWTDPPYNVAYKAAAGVIANDNQADGDFRQFLESAFRAMHTHMKPGAAIYVAHSDTEGLNFRAAFAASGLKLSGCIIWRKDSLVLGRSDYQWQHEPILYGWRRGSPHRWYGGRKQTTVADLSFGDPFVPTVDGRWQISIGNRVLIVASDAEVVEVVPSVIREDRPKKSALHPTMKPTALVERLLGNNARAGDLVLDPFGGSGSTLIAADRLGMSACLCEIDPKYADVIVLRWQEYCGRKAKRESDGALFDDLTPRSLAA